MSQLINENIFAYMLVYPMLFTAVVVTFCFVWNLLWKHCKNSKLELLINTIAGAGFLMICYPGYLYNHFIGSAVAIDFLQISAAIITIWVIKYIRLNYADYVLLIISTFLIKEYCYPKGFVTGMLFLGSFTILCIVIKRKYGVLKKMSVQVIISFLSASLVYWIYELIFDQGLRYLYYDYSRQWHLERLQKFIFLMVLSAAFVMVMCIVIGLIGKVLQLYLEKLQSFSKKYEEIGAYLLAIPYFIGVLLLIMDGFGKQYYYGKNFTYTWVTMLSILFFGTQIFYIKLLISTIRLKQHLEYKEMEQTNLNLYEKNLRMSIQEIREMKHDLKNVFLTMGDYVARSDDQELQEYYYEKIAPYARNEIRMNDMYVELQELQNESMKAFLYYKLLQGMDAKIDMRFETMLDHSVLPYLEDASELTRIIGIFLDNALEECSQLTNGVIWVRVVEKSGEMSISVKNAVREEVIKNGIHAGTTSKGLGRGNGLQIVKKIVNKHDDILWNSYFQDGVFAQSITIVHGAWHKR